MEAIRCQGLSKTHGNIVALNDLSLAVEEQSVFGFLGPNGAGKTTTVRLLTGLSTPTAGRAWVAGEEVSTGSPAWRSKTGRSRVLRLDDRTRVPPLCRRAAPPPLP